MDKVIPPKPNGHPLQWRWDGVSWVWNEPSLWKPEWWPTNSKDASNKLPNRITLLVREKPLEVSKKEIALVYNGMAARNGDESRTIDENSFFLNPYCIHSLDANKKISSTGEHNMYFENGDVCVLNVISL